MTQDVYTGFRNLNPRSGIFPHRIRNSVIKKSNGSGGGGILEWHDVIFLLYYWRLSQPIPAHMDFYFLHFVRS
jgi:hypothetical protein